MITSQQLLMAAALGLPILLLGGQADAIPQNLSVQVPQDFLTINSSSRRFFETGNDRFEQEIEGLIQGNFAFSEDLLMIDEGVGLEDDWERLERLHDSLDEIERIDLGPL